MFLDPDTNRMFYVHKDTQERNWKPPRDKNMPGTFHNEMYKQVRAIIYLTFEHDKNNKMICMPSKDLDQPRGASNQSDQSSLGALLEVKGPNCLHVDSKNSDQTGWMPQLI